MRSGFQFFQEHHNCQNNCQSCKPYSISNLSQDTPTLSEALKLWQPNKKAASMINRWRSQRQCLAGAIIHDARRISTESISKTINKYSYKNPPNCHSAAETPVQNAVNNSASVYRSLCWEENGLSNSDAQVFRIMKGLIDGPVHLGIWSLRTNPFKHQNTWMKSCGSRG